MAFFRHQLLILKRSAPARVKLRNADRLIFVRLYRLFPFLLGATVIFKPETITLVPERLPSLMALEVAPSSRRPTCGPDRRPRSDPDNQPR
jgi:hypothetical protein